MAGGGHIARIEPRRTASLLIHIALGVTLVAAAVAIGVAMVSAIAGGAA